MQRVLQRLQFGFGQTALVSDLKYAPQLDPARQARWMDFHAPT
jgi:hypothetical protein